jgi:hypothetical protein
MTTIFSFCPQHFQHIKIFQVECFWQTQKKNRSLELFESEATCRQYFFSFIHFWRLFQLKVEVCVMCVSFHDGKIMSRSLWNEKKMRRRKKICEN